jgi:predicted extracellular nuclease
MKPFLSICTLAGLVVASATQAAVVINEIDYDQPGADTAEFIELYNSSSTSTALDTFSINLINGGDDSVYRSIDLSGYSLAANSYFVVCDSASQVANCNYAFTSSSGWLQNGAPDAVALLENGSIVDSLSYEGDVALATEGSVTTLADSGTITTSLSRFPNGVDTNNNLAGFQLGCITPGAANITGSGDCSAVAVSTVPVPAAGWLFASGLFGMIGFSRKRLT